MPIRTSLFAAFLILIWSLPAAATIYVPADYATIGEAITAAPNGETIEVSAGTYAEAVDFEGKDLVLLGVDGSATTIIDSATDGILADGAATADIQGFTIIADAAGLISTAPSLVLTDLVFDGAGVPSAAYALDISGTTDLTATDVEVTSYVSLESPAGYLDSCEGINWSGQGFHNLTNSTSGALVISDSSGTFTDVTFQSMSGGTAAIEVDGLQPNQTITFFNCLFNLNSAVALMVSDGDVVVDSSEFDSNTAGALQAWAGATVSLLRSRFYDNSNAAADGGAVYAANSEVSADYCTFTGNQGLNGGAIAADNSSGPITIQRSSLLDNTATILGGGIHMAAGELQVAGSLLSENTAAANGGGIYLDGTDAEIVNATLVGNDAPQGSGIATATGLVDLINVIVANGVGAFGISGDANVSVDYCDVVGHQVANFDGMTDPTGTNGNISVDPLFIDEANDDYHLQSIANGDPQDSPCIDTGDPDPALDDLDGTRSDIGAYGGPSPLETDEDQDGWSVELGDCDDADDTAFPGNTEVCDAVDNNCDGAVDEGFDADGDGVTVCGPDGNYNNADDDCDDADAEIYPAHPEECDGIDNNCDGQLSAGETDDVDGDGWPDCNDCDDSDEDLNHDDADFDGYSTCDGDCDDDDNRLHLMDWDGDGYTTCDGDCDDSDALLNLDDLDLDGGSSCDGDCNDEDPDENHLDSDNDGYSTCDGDCHDGQGVTFPGAPETCDGYDNDCDGEVGEGEVDTDADGFMICEGDCDDEDPSTYLGATEVCDGKDNNCDDHLDSEESDDDGDGYNECQHGDCNDSDASIHPDASEACNDIDDNCNGVIDELEDCYVPDYSVSGGGGCGADVGVDRSGRGGLALLLGLLALVVLRSRRLRRSGAAVLTLAALVVGGAAPAVAQDTRPAIELHSLRANGDSLGLFGVESAEVLGLLKPSFGFHLSYAKDPLLLHIEENPIYPQDKYDYNLVETMLTMDLQGAVGFGVADVAVALPIHLARMGEGALDFEELTGGGIGDLRLTPKVTIFNPGRRMYGLAVALPLTFPLAYASSAVGDPSVRIEPTVVGEFRYGPLQTMLNIGPRLRTKEMAQNELDIAVQHEFVFRYGLGVKPIPQLQVIGEIMASSGGEGSGVNPAEWFAGARIWPGKGMRIDLGAGRGFNDGYGVPDFRFMAGLTFAKEQDYAPLDHKDSDGDGVTDNIDACRKEPEDKDGWEDDDGCPDKDNDRDGFLDKEDKCPDEAENFNANEDDDGCPDDDPDQDGDGLADKEDPCPSDAEIINGVDDFDGCPEEALARVSNDWKRIAVESPITFKKETMVAECAPVTNAVAAILLAYPEISKLEIQTHTDDVGSEKTNNKVSQARAEYVANLFVEAGVAADRLKAVGYGESKPILPGTTKEARSINRRVEFHILTLTETPQPVTGKPPEAAVEGGSEGGSSGRELTDEEKAARDQALKDAARAREAAGQEEGVKATWGEEEEEATEEPEATDSEPLSVTPMTDDSKADKKKKGKKEKKEKKKKEKKGKKGKADEEATEEAPADGEEEAETEEEPEEKPEEKPEEEDEDYDPWAE